MAGKHKELKMKLSTRRYIYGIGLALGPLAVSYGIISEQEWPLFLSVLASIVVPGVALQNMGGAPHDDDSRGKRAKE